MGTVTQQMVDDARASLIADESTWPPGLPEEAKIELRLRRALQEQVVAILERNLGKDELDISSWEQFATTLDEIAREQTGMEYGLPLPSTFDMKRPLITARRVPIRTYETELAEELAGQRVRVRNSWNVLGDKSVAIVEAGEELVVFPRYAAGNRMRKMMDGALLRAGMPIDADTELRAMDSLKPRVSKGQWDSYVLSGIFPEHSKRSDLHYFFRKGYPTLVLSYHGCSEGRVIAALCLHPVGYYQGSHCGLMTPTDEVICALLMMRGDERKYWASCGQWSASDPRSGV